MSYDNRLFVDAVKNYPSFKSLFKKFCDAAVEQLNENIQLPNVKFSPDVDGASAKLTALDRTFDISLRFLIVANVPHGVLLVSHTGENKEPDHLSHFFFDHVGNVKASLDASATHGLSSVDFVMKFINQFIKEYFSHQMGMLK